MRLVVTGAGGFVGQRLVAELLERGTLDGAAITEVTCIDRRFPPTWSPRSTPGARVERVVGDFNDPGTRDAVFRQSVDGVFHLAATLTAEAEKAFDDGLANNLVGTLGVLEDCRRHGGLRLVFASSMSVFGGELPEVVEDESPRHPPTSYGVQKAIVELLLDDFTRRGFLDGRALRLPAILIRPKGSDPSISEHLSALVREPLHSNPLVCPFAPETAVPVASVGAAARALIALFEIESKAVGAVRTINLPALSVSPAGMLAAVERRVGRQASTLVSWQLDDTLNSMLSGMPRAFVSERAARLGIAAEPSFDAVIDDYLHNTHPEPA